MFYRPLMALLSAIQSLYIYRVVYSELSFSQYGNCMRCLKGVGKKCFRMLVTVIQGTCHKLAGYTGNLDV